jgi:hypothetical protein
MTTDTVVLSGLLAEIILRQLPCGGWAALASSSQPALEPTCFAALALGSIPGGAFERAQEFLLHTQNPNGSWPAFAGDESDGGWVTSLAVLALRDEVPAIPTRLQGAHWLVSCAGREGNWFWKWKFRTFDRHVRFDPEKFGWPKNILHWKGIQESVLDLCATVQIHFVIADGIVAMEGNGPLNGTPRHLGKIVIADDPVAADATCARLMGFEPDRIVHIREGSRSLGNASAALIDQVGENLNEPAAPFQVVSEFQFLYKRTTGVP